MVSVATILALEIQMSFIHGVADSMEDLPPSFRQNVAQSFNDALENHIPPALELMIHTTVTNALTTALPPLLAPIRNTLTRIENKMERMETKLTRVEIMQAKVSFCVSTHVCCKSMSIINPRCSISLKAVGQM